MSWNKNVNALPALAITLGVGFGLAFFVLGTFGTALGATAGGNAIENVITAFTSFLTTYLTPILAIIAIGVIYAIVKSTGLLNRGKD